MPVKVTRVFGYAAAVAGSSVAANKVHLALWNGSGSRRTIRIRNITVSTETTAAVTGFQMGIRVNRITSAPSGGTAVTIAKLDSSNPDLPAQITASTGPSVTLGPLLMAAGINPEETGGPGYTAPLYVCREDEQCITLREGEGIAVSQYGTAGVGLVDVFVIFEVF